MTARAQRLKLRLFLEGVEVPVISVQTQCTPNAPLVAAIQITPLAEGTRLLPRTLVHLFFQDFYEEESPFLSENRDPSATTTRERNPTAYEKSLQNRRKNFAGESDGERKAAAKDLADDFANQRYKLLFVGEVLGFGWKKQAGGRQLILQCADLSNYWDYAYQWSNTGIFGPGKKALFSGGSTNLHTDFLSSKSEVLVRTLRQKSITFPRLKGLAGGIVHMMEAIGGTYYRHKKISGQNIFFTTAELRLHIMQTVMAIEDDPTASRLVGNAGYGGLFGRIIGGLGGQTSIRQVMKALSATIFHETYAQPCPVYEPGLEGTVSGSVRVKLSSSPRTSFVPDGARTTIEHLEDIKRQVNVVDENPELRAALLVSREAVGTQRKAIIRHLKLLKKFLSSLIVKLRKLVRVSDAGGLLNSASTSIGVAATRMEKWRPDNSKRIKAVSDKIDHALERLTRLGSLTVTGTKKKDVSPARLNQQIFRPDCWFTAPPRCNVLFPENYDQLEYTRDFMQEPTRLLLKTNEEFFGEDELFDKYYFAPKTRSLKKTRAQMQDMLKNDLLEHEIMTGILPVFEKMGELNIFAYRGGKVSKKMQKVGLAQRSANFIYFKYRFGARQMTVGGKFNPYIACGFPGLIIDKWVDIETLKLHDELLKRVGRPTRDITKLLGTNFLGNFTQCQHQISQEQGKTTLVCSYPRQPEEGVEFLGASDKEENVVSKRFENDVARTVDVAAIAQPKVGSPGPSFGKIVAVEEVTQLYRGSGSDIFPEPSTKSLRIFTPFSFSANPRLPEFFAKERSMNKEGGPREVIVERVPVGFLVDPQTLAPRVRVGLGLDPSDTGFITIRAFRITEEVPRYKQESVDLPAEEYIRPGWYGDIWHPANVGKAYQQYFRTGAITDVTHISNPAGGTFSAENNMRDKATEEAATGVFGAEDPRGNALALYSLEQNASIEQAVGFLVATYSHIKTQGFDVDEFIRAYTWRPIATMVDMFGTSDLQLSPDGQFIVQGIEGFHSRAFGPFDNLFGLVTPEIEEVVGIKRGTTAAVRGDTRKRKQSAVKDYVAALGFARAILG